MTHGDVKNGIAVHANTHLQHTIQWDSAQIMDREDIGSREESKKH